MMRTQPDGLSQTRPQPPDDRTAASSPDRACVISSRLRPDDRRALLDLFDRSTPQTRLRRFHHALAAFPQRYLGDILSGRQLAVVARDTCHAEGVGRVLGVASAAPANGTEAEFAVWVDDAWQGRGVGSMLVRAVLAELADAGVAAAIGFMQPDNVAVRRLVRKVAPNAVFRTQDDVIVVHIPLAGHAGSSCPVQPGG